MPASWLAKVGEGLAPSRGAPQRSRADVRPGASPALRVARLRTAAFAASIALGLFGCGKSDPNFGLARGSNILVVSLDAVRADRIGGYGYEAAMTPNVDAFLEQSVVFEEALAVRALTEPSLTSMLTGLYPYEHEVVGNGYQMRDPAPANIIDAFKAAGYEVRAVSANGCKAMRQFDWDFFHCTKTRDALAVKDALRLIEESRDKPQLLWLHLFAAHSPYGGRQHARELYPDYAGPADGGNLKLRELSRSRQATAQDLAFVNARYDGGVRGADHNFGRVLEQVEKSWPGAVVLLTADHGEELGDHDKYLFHACSTYRAGLRVPLAIRAPGLEPRRVRRTVENLDVASTLLSLAGIEPPSEVQIPGTSLLASDAGSEHAYSSFDTYPIWTVQDRGWRLVVNPENTQLRCYPGADRGVVTIRETELYRLADDPNEQVNVADQHPDRVANLRATLEAWPGYGRPSQRQDLDEETRKELEALGYVN